MILYAVFANAILIASVYIPVMDPWYMQLLVRTAIFIMYLHFANKSKDTAPESRFNRQRFILIVSCLIALYIAFEPAFTQRKVSAGFKEYSMFVAAFIAGTLFVRRNYYAGD